jgi:hypothetical protein
LNQDYLTVESLWQELCHYTTLTQEFSDFSLGHPEDIINAFSGILPLIFGSFAGGLYQRLPELWLDIAVLWQRFERVAENKRLGLYSKAG